jgi:hypothetical protein
MSGKPSSRDKAPSNKKPRYYVKRVDRGAGAPNWAIYERLPHGNVAVCLCYTESMARHIMRLLAADGDTERRNGKG